MEVIKCKYCEKIIEGYSKKHIDYMMKQHILAKHPNEDGEKNE